MRRKIQVDGDIIILALVVVTILGGTVAGVVAEMNAKKQCNESYRTCVENHANNCEKVMERCR